VNASTTPWRFNADLRIDKTFEIGRYLQLSFYVRVLNLFNTRQVENVYPYSGSAQTDGMIGDSYRNRSWLDYVGEEGIGIYNAINTTNGQSYWDLTGNELYRSPRQIFFGVKVEY